MTLSDLIDLVAEKSNLPRTKAEAVVSQILESMVGAMKRGERVEIRGLGNFTMRSYNGHGGRNPKTGESLEVKPKRLPHFKPAKELKARVNGSKKEK